MFPQLCNRPMHVSLTEARHLLSSYGLTPGRQHPFDPMAHQLRSLARFLKETPCPTCRGTGFSHTLHFGPPKRDKPD